jgi:hypothetical protein
MQRPVRVLLPWLDRDEAVAILHGRLAGPGEDVTAHVAAWENAKASLISRTPYALPGLSTQPLAAELLQRADTFRQRSDVQTGLQGFTWELGIVDLNQVLSFQKIVNLEQAEERVTAINQDDWGALFSLCLPDPSPPEQLQGLSEPGKTGIVFSSLNPNLRVVGQAVMEQSPAPGQLGQSMKFVGFAIGLGSSFVQVAEYKQRWFLRDGYHRCYGLLRKGITRIPCVFIRALAFEHIGANKPDFIKYETLLGEHPPFLKDFLDDQLSTTVQQTAVRKAVRISADEFLIQI